ncbi:hypothetical protein [Butyribacter sp.]|uniref:hypothetical protein n=1 Tax=Butyribacter sp. TaxID=2822465 RepID=UPI002A99A614|nr:hypothetical protein [Butyribacter sp.]
MKKRFLAVVMGLVITVSIITGCSEKNSSDSSSNTASSDAASSSNSDNSNSYTSAEVSEYTIYGKVKSVSDDGKITYEVLSRDENQPQKPHGSGAPDAKNGEKPQKPHGSGAPDAKNGEKPQKPHGSGAPDAKGGMPGFKSTGETSTVTLGDNVIVQKAGMNQEKTDASVSDIKKGCIIEIALDGDNVSKVLIREETGKNAKNTDKETSGSGNSTN